MARLPLNAAILRVSDSQRFGLLFLLLLGIVSGCATLYPQQERVKVTIANITPMDSTLMEQRFLVRLRIQNRTQKPMTIDGMSFDLELNGKDFASGVSNQQVTATAYGEALLDVKVSSTIFGVIRQIQSVQKLKGKPFHYEISGRLSSPDHFFTVPFRESGEIDLGIPGEQATGRDL
jgi:LEA14-like dessication related protein